MDQIENKKKEKTVLITAALPYANSALHIGHLVEYLQADYWNRFLRMLGHKSYYICADDTHGTPIMVAANKMGIHPEDHIKNVEREHLKDFNDFEIDFSHFSSTHSQENKKWSEYVYQKIKDRNHLHSQTIEQYFCEKDGMFLPDRFVKGTCPKCQSEDQYGDNCDRCGSTYSPTDLLKAYCSLCHNPPIKKQSDHILLKLNDFNEFLLNWLPQHTPKEVTNKMKEWFQEPLRDWDISRDAPYFGFLIPGYKDKYFYVWLDAPIGYVSTTEQLCNKEKLSFDLFWSPKAEEIKSSELYHFIGKDIVYFHTLFWPAVLSASDLRTPTQVFVHGFLTVNGEKMSKSKGTQISVRSYLDHLNPLYLRYYLASKMNSGLDDIDFNHLDFVSRVNSDLIGKLTNLGSRSAQMLNKKGQGLLSTLFTHEQEPHPDFDSSGRALLKLAQSKSGAIESHYMQRDFAKAISEIRMIVDEANRYFDDQAPWKIPDSEFERARTILTVSLNVFRILVIYLNPILPSFTQKVAHLFGESPASALNTNTAAQYDRSTESNHPNSYLWTDAQIVIQNKIIQSYQHLIQRIDSVQVDNLMNSQKAQESLPQQNKSFQEPSPNLRSDSTQQTLPSLDIKDFLKVELRIAKIISAEEIEDSQKLLKLTVSLGPLGQRTIIAGIKSSYLPEKIIGRLILVVANLAPRKMKFGVSEGMALLASHTQDEFFLLSPDNGASPGDLVK